MTLPARPLHEFAVLSLRRTIFGLLPYEHTLVLSAGDAREAIARTQAALAEYVYTVLGADEAVYERATVALDRIQEALADLWASVPPDGVAVSALEDAVRTACLPALPTLEAR